ncbi:hypothetical protein DYH55_03885 [Methylovirgula sp. 4M-Z18]|nr:hypothetical protein DYH55_03885 [Methylovirgula sp. 4M-Z18]
MIIARCRSLNLVTREHILSEIRRLASKNGGQAPGNDLFFSATGIRVHEWRGVYWVKWSDALREAGLTPNERQHRYTADFLFAKLAEAARHFNAVPGDMQMKMYKQVDQAFPARQTFGLHFRSRQDLLSRFREWLATRAEYEGVLAMLPAEDAPTSDRGGARC